VYQAHFQLNQEPFSIAPDPSFLYLSKAHQEALAHLMYGFSHGGFVLITGEVGTGKTTLLRNLLKQTPPDLDVAFILNPRLTVRELLETLCQELGAPYDRNATQTVKQYIDALNRHLLHTYQNGRSTVVIIDEAQNLSPAVLEQIRLLTNLETDEKKLLRIILVGQPELTELLARQELRQLAQRITARYHLGALSREDTYAYVAHRLSRAGGYPQIFTPAALRRIYRLSGGVPRIINVIADRALLGAYADNRRRVSARIVSRAAREVLGEGSKLKMWIPAGLAALALAGIAWAYLQPDISAPGEGITHTQAAGPTVVTQEEPVPAESSIVAETVEPAAADEVETPAQSETAAPVGQSEAESRAPVKPAADGSSLAGRQKTSNDPATARASDPVPLHSSVQRPVGSTYSAQRQAYAAVFERWGANYPTSDDTTIPCDFAPSAGLQCLSQYGSWSNIEQSNLPVILELWDEQPAPYHGALLAMADGVLTLSVGGEKFRIAQRDLRDAWYGAYVILWQTPPGYIGSIRQGETHATVAWLRQQLAGLTSVDVTSNQPEFFDEALYEAVVEFQRDQGLIIDGVVGPATWIRLSSQLNLPSPGLES